MIDWQDLHVFGAVARHGTLTAAASELRLDHATVSRRLSNLEAALGVVLVQRFRRGCRLTPAGAEIAALVRGLESQAAAIQRVARASTTTLSGEVRVSAPPALASQVLALEAARIRSAHRGVCITLIGETRTASLAAQEADLAIRLSRPRESDAAARKVGEIAFRPYALESWLQATPEADWTFVTYDQTLEAAPQERALRRFAGEREIAFRANDLLSLVQACCAGLGVAMLPDYIGETHPELAPVEFDGSPVIRELWMVVHADVRRSPAVRAVMDAISTALRERFKPGTAMAVAQPGHR